MILALPPDVLRVLPEECLVCATHRDLPAMVAEGKFRADLLARLADFTLHLPPLRERKEDLYLLARTTLVATPAGALATGDLGYAAALASDGKTVAEDPRATDVPLTRAAVDPSGTCWVAGLGQLFRRDAGDGPQPWTVVWSDPGLASPFVTLAAFSGLVLAAAEDGSVVTGHQAR